MLGAELAEVGHEQRGAGRVVGSGCCGRGGCRGGRGKAGYRASQDGSGGERGVANSRDGHGRAQDGARLKLQKNIKKREWH